MTNAPSRPLVDTDQLEELVRQFFASADDADPAPSGDIFAGADLSSIIEQTGMEQDEQDPLFTHITQRAMLNIPVSEAEVDRKLHDGPD
jgi:hypothetical protein